VKRQAAIRLRNAAIGGFFQYEDGTGHYNWARRRISRGARSGRGTSSADPMPGAPGSFTVGKVRESGMPDGNPREVFGMTGLCRFSLPLPFLLALSLSLAFLCSSLAHADEGAEPLVLGETFTINSKSLGETRRINVFRPSGVAADSRLPVLYMPDGGMAEDFLHIAGLLQVSVINGTMRPFLLVGIENTQRRRDLTGPTGNAEDRKIAPRVGGSATFRRFIRDELMPQVKLRYRTTSETAIVGESLAGLFVVETLLREPDLFDTYIAIDPSLWWNEQEMVLDAAKQLRARPDLKESLFLGCSGEERIRGVFQRFVDVLEKQAPPGLRWHCAKMPEETHATVFHPMALKAVRALFKPAN
jgi:predicted alpha/beta superfamily hydrolase